MIRIHMLKKTILVIMLFSSCSIFALDDTKTSKCIFKPINKSKTELKKYLNVNETNSWMYKYIQISENIYLYTNDGPAIGAGLYYLNLTTQVDKRLLPGYGNDIKFLRQKNIDNGIQFFADKFCFFSPFCNVRYSRLPVSQLFYKHGTKRELQSRFQINLQKGEALRSKPNP